MNKLAYLTLPVLLLVVMQLQSCTSVTVDEYVAEDDAATYSDGDSVVILGRRHTGNHETEPGLIDCVGDIINDQKGVFVIPEKEFLNNMYPWFEPRTAPLHMRDIKRLLSKPLVAKRLDEYQIRYIIWIDGSTQTTSKAGSIGCTIGAGGAGCFGFGTWDKESDYEAAIWDIDNLEVDGKISADASGTSYMPALIIPVPIIAQVQDNACEALGTQLSKFFISAGTNDSAP